MVLHSVAIILLTVASSFIEPSIFASEDQRVKPAEGYEWLVQIPDGWEVARELADDYDLQLVKQYHNSLGADIYLFRRHTLAGDAQRARRAAHPVGIDEFPVDPRVKWAERQVGKVRQKRDYLSQTIPLQSKRWLDSRIRTSLSIDSSLPPAILLKPWDTAKLPTVDLEVDKIGHSSSTTDQMPASFFDDPMWDHQWYLSTNQLPLGSPHLTFPFAFRSSRDIDGNETLTVPMDADLTPKVVSLNVVPVWEGGYTGRGVVVTILDDGVETNHTDLIQNYDPEASTDINGEDRDPTPRYDHPEETHHGTRCAGEVAMQANNNFCGVGIAYNAKIGGIRMLDGSVTDRVEAEAFSFNNHYIDIYSSSWGPSDDGKTVEGPGLMASRALEKGGRNGKGVIYVWASGNGGIVGDSCAYDGYASNIFTVSIGSATEHGNFPIYGEICPSTMAVTYSSGSLKEGKIVSSDILNGCTAEHTGTSASAPLAAGMIALMLESNPNITWRDVKHIIAWSADPIPLLNNPGWTSNGVGLLVSPAFGFGLLNAQKLITTAKTWLTVPPKTKCVVRKAGVENVFLTQDKPLEIQVRTQACQGSPNEVRHLEQTELIVSLSHIQRGALRISLVSPMGTRTLIAPLRYMDQSSDGLNSWPFISVHNWGEDPMGTWTVIFESHLNVTELDFAPVGSLHSLRLVFHGTKEPAPSLPAVQKEKGDYAESLRLSKTFTE